MSDETNEQPKCTMAGPAPQLDEEEEDAPPQCAPLLTRDTILGSDDMRLESVYVKDWAGVVYVRTLRGDEGQRFEEAVTHDDGTIDGTAFLVGLAVAAVCDENGNALFLPEDAETLKRKSYGALKEIFVAASRLNGYTKKDVDEALKNSAASPA